MSTVLHPESSNKESGLVIYRITQFTFVLRHVMHTKCVYTNESLERQTPN